MMTKTKAHLEPDEVLRVAVAALLKGLDHAAIAEVLGVNNPGRITEAALAMQWAAENHKTLYRHVKRLRARKKQERNGAAETEPKPGAVSYDMKLLETSH